MRVRDIFHLTYCSNIHPAETWDEVRRNLETYLPPIRNQVSPQRSFAIGLRLSAEAARNLEARENLEQFQSFLQKNDYYIFTLNGFPYGAFHGTRVKEKVYHPDWRDPLRLDYSNRLARLLASLLPAGQPEMEGSVSTVPGAFKEDVRTEEDIEKICQNLLRHVSYLHRLEEETGRTVTLALEPEPCCFLETIEEVVNFFQQRLFRRDRLSSLGKLLNFTSQQAEDTLRRHLGICYDACHMAVEFEGASEALQRLNQAGIRICKFHISSAIEFEFEGGIEEARKALAPYVESTYLHQVVEKSGTGIKRYLDLPEALSPDSAGSHDLSSGGKKTWRVHFHVPVFSAGGESLRTTQPHLITLLEELKHNPVSPYLEVETYTWDVLPERDKGIDLVNAISRELDWVISRLEETGS